MKQRPIWSLLTALVLASALSGCATGTNPRDPLENFNRKMFAFNDKVDQVALKPVAIVYQKRVPSFMQTGVANFFGNLEDAWSGVNNLLQGNGAEGMSDIMRFAVNSTFGFAGLLDIGSEAGLPKHSEDFGQTLGKWGVKPGPYVVLPVFGPSTLRDTAVMPLDMAADPWTHVTPNSSRFAGSVLRAVDQRARVLDASRMIEEAALDKYEFVRDAYLQRREGQVKSGEVSDEDEAAEKQAKPAQTEQESKAPLQPVPKNLDKEGNRGARDPAKEQVAPEATEGKQADAAPAPSTSPASAPATPTAGAAQTVPQPVKK
ncbi:MAG TPA: VacJ family lipoprotein [Burkholderiaceae bacterium]